MSKKIILLTFILFVGLSFSNTSEARSTHNRTIGILGMGNVQLFDTDPEFQVGGGGGIYFDYRFNQRFSVTGDIWVTSHDGEGSASNDNGIEILGMPTTTLKLYLFDGESKWDPYIGMGIGVYYMSEGGVENGTNGIGIGAHIDLGFDYYLNDTFSVGFSGIFRSAGIIRNLDGDSDSATALVPFTMMARGGYHF